MGVEEGAYVLFWRDYFENATIVGVDFRQFQIDDTTGRIHIYHGYQQDIDLLERIAREQAPDGFDVIIDDCSHIGRLARVSFWHLFQNHLKPGGLYAIEDWGTSYTDWRPDGMVYRSKSVLLYTCKERIYCSFACRLYRFQFLFPRVYHYFPRFVKFAIGWFIGSRIPSHTYGMAGFIKELLDACCLGEMVSLRSGNGRYRHNRISRMHITADVVIVEKSTESQVSQ